MDGFELGAGRFFRKDTRQLTFSESGEVAGDDRHLVCFESSESPIKA